MIKNFKVKTNENIILKKLDITYIDKIMGLQKIVFDGLEDKRLYSPSCEDEFISFINTSGTILGCLNEKEDLIAMGVFVKYNYNEHNYGYDLNLEGSDLLSVGQIESTIVREDYRGNRIQKILCEELEYIGKNTGISLICATASPYNKFSVNTFLNLNYEIKADKLKYGGLRRYVFAKKC